MANTVQFSKQRRSLLSSQARIQAPWIKVSIGDYTFGVFSKSERKKIVDSGGFYSSFNVQYPNYINSLSITKINGQVNQYTLSLSYPVTADSDPNFFEKVLSSVSGSRKIVFSYGDSSMPTYVYKDEEAIITKVTSSFGFSNQITSVINYQIYATSGAALSTAASCTFISDGQAHKPSDVIKDLFRNSKYGLKNTFTGMANKNLAKFIDGTDKPVVLSDKTNISVLDYITYLVSCMIPEGTTDTNISKDIYILTIHDDTTYDRAYADPEIVDGQEVVGPYFKVTRTSYAQEHTDAYEIDIGYNNSTIVTSFSVTNGENYSLYYDYQGKLTDQNYVRRLNGKGQ